MDKVNEITNCGSETESVIYNSLSNLNEVLSPGRGMVSHSPCLSIFTSPSNNAGNQEKLESGVNSKILNNNYL